ncbi:MAG: hypothetical protein ACTSYE_11550 [Alphaproteobacteria bacterium]
MTLLIPLFLMPYWIGLLATLLGVIPILVACELSPLPWDVEMSALVDGATRRQAFVHIALQQSRAVSLRSRSSPSSAAGRRMFLFQPSW